MKKVFVTGATGFIGASLARELRDLAVVRARQARIGSKVSGLKSSFGKDLGTGIQQGLAGCDTLFHAAADYRLWTRDPLVRN
jgi:dihydroflavonol-4-reductase